ncbi:Serum paraoxonase/lactonase 3 [Lunasporangiospora selenospora]|uniref:Serum paraoxonase/lactonase 3 n=1 Tax=Lunasporangiospora selenospora TaxID=979761 RepID=A0A9P6FZW0_9FUNG|nr:Serum paraoxonase/lactonase 3 [Lunasporangiospora selenospora]
MVRPEFVRRPWSDLVYYSPEQTKVVYSGVISANGLAANSDKSEIYMTACHGAGFYILRPGGSHDPTVLELEAFLKLDYYVDNPTYDPTTDSVFIAGHLQPLKFVAGLEVPHVRLAGPSKVIKISKNSLKHQQEQLSHQHSLVDTLKKALTNRGPEPGNRYHVETVIQDDGGLISTSATAAIDRKNGVVLIAAVLSEQGLIRCPLPKGF